MSQALSGIFINIYGSVKQWEEILKQQSTFIICFILLLSFIFMANGYSLIKTRLNLTGNTFIVSNGDEKEEWQPKVSFKLTK